MKNRAGRLSAAFFAAAAAVVLAAFPAMAGDWKKGTGENADSWWYDLGSGKWAKGWEWIDGDNDGMVSTDSMHWANFRGVHTSTKKRGISHADVVDMRRRRFTKRTCALRQRSAPALSAPRPMPILNLSFPIRRRKVKKPSSCCWTA